MSSPIIGTPKAPERPAGSPRIISVSGGKGGVGKTFFTVNFAVELRHLGYRVLVFDGDVDLSNVNLLLHIDENNGFGDFLNGKIGIDRIVRKGVGGVDVIYVGDEPDDTLRFTEEQYAYLTAELGKLEENYDFVLIDTQAGLSEMNRRLIEDSDSVIMIANQEITSLVDLYKTIKLYAADKPGLPFHVVVNKIAGPDRAVKIYEGLRDTLSANDVRASVAFLGYVLDDPPRAIASIQKRTPIRLLGDAGSLGGCFRLITETYLRSAERKKKRRPLFLSLFSRGDS